MQSYYENHRDVMANAFAWHVQDDHCTPHFHNSIELVYVLSGNLHASLDGQDVCVGPGEMLINSSYTVHSYATPEASQSIVAIIPLAEVPSLRQTLTKKSFARTTIQDDDTGTLRHLMDMLAGAQSPIVTKGLCYTLLGLTIERAGLVEVRTPDRAAFIRSVLDFLQQHHTEPLTVEQIASHFGYSRSRFSHLFSERLGYTVCDYLGALRCHHAAQLLRETDLSVSQIAMAVGFESLRTFYRTFKKQYKLTPNQYALAQF